MAGRGQRCVRLLGNGSSSFRFRDIRTVTTKAAISTILDELTGFLPRRSGRITLRNVAASAFVLHVASAHTCVALRAGSDGCVQAC